MTLGKRSGWALALALGMATGAAAQDPPKFTAGPLKFQGYVDGYYSFNNNHPASRNNGYDRFFDIQANQFSLNMAGLYMSTDAEPVGMTLQLGFGRGWDIFHATEPNNSPAVVPGGASSRSLVRFIPQAYVTVKPKSMKGFTFDFGKFVTSAEAEVTESHLGWNYSRSLLYSNGPFYHMGARMTQAVNDKWTVGVQLVNGWNNVEDNNTKKSIGLTSALVFKKWALYNVYYGGPEVGDGKGSRHFLNNVITLTPSDKVSAYMTYDYGVDKGNYGIGRGNNNWWAANAAMKIQWHPSWSTAFRYDFYNDIDGLILGGARRHQEFTGTMEYKITGAGNLMMRGEYRRDWASTPFFDKGNQAGSGLAQTTVTLGVMAYFGY
jgi:Putative beta-barrel porin-2, OmpL-like. bbp2